MFFHRPCLLYGTIDKTRLHQPSISNLNVLDVHGQIDVHLPVVDAAFVVRVVGVVRVLVVQLELLLVPVHDGEEVVQLDLVVVALRLAVRYLPKRCRSAGAMRIVVPVFLRVSFTLSRINYNIIGQWRIA